MKSESGKFLDAVQMGFGLLTDSLLEASTNMGGQLAKDSISNIIVEFIIDTASSLLPGASVAVSSYKRLRAEKT